MSPQPKRGKVDPAREAAYDVLVKVRTQDSYANLLLPGILRERGLSGRDAGFATELSAGTLRMRGGYDPIIDACLRKSKLEPRLRDALRLGAHQLLSMRVPPHAAIDSTVNLVSARLGRAQSGFANAVLRKISTKSLGEWHDELGVGKGRLDELALRTSHPAWVIAELERSLAAIGAEGELEELLRADNVAPTVTLVARPGIATPEEIGGARGRLSPYAITGVTGDPGTIPAVVQERAGVQDEGSQLVALAIAEAAMADDDRRWLDVCAGPGGKAALLAALAAQRGARVLAAELHPHRAALVAKATRSVQAGTAGVVCADGSQPPWLPGTFDRALIDAPCTGLGALRRRPEARWRRTPGDVASLVKLQQGLLAATLSSTRIGGLVCYATCSPLLAETADVVQPLIDAGRVAVVPLTQRWPDALGPIEGTVQLWPHRHETDAMFVAVLRVLEGEGPENG